MLRKFLTYLVHKAHLRDHCININTSDITAPGSTSYRDQNTNSPLETTKNRDVTSSMGPDSSIITVQFPKTSSPYQSKLIKGVEEGA